MKTIGQVAADVAEWFFVAGHPAAHTFLEHITDHIEVDGIDQTQPLRYQGDKPAYCKYCYTSHEQWRISNEHFPPAWVCEQCNYATADERMEIE